MVQELVRYLRRLQAYDPVKNISQEEQKSVMEQHMQQLRNAVHVDNVFDVVKKYSSFFNYKIFADMILEYGTEHDKTAIEEV